MKKVLLLLVFSLAAGIFNPVFAGRGEWVEGRSYDLSTSWWALPLRDISVSEACKQRGHHGCTEQESTLTCAGGVIGMNTPFSGVLGTETFAFKDTTTVDGRKKSVSELFREGEHAGLICDRFGVSHAHSIFFTCGGCRDK